MKSKKINSDQKHIANQIADNLIELSNIQYLFKYVNFVEPDPQEVFIKCLQQTQNIDRSKMTELSLRGKYELIPYSEFSIDENISKEQVFESIIKQQVRKSLSTNIPIRPLSKQQLLYMGHTKIAQQKQRQEKQIARSRRSFQYIQSLKQKISSSTEREQSKQQQSQQRRMQINEMLRLLQKLQQERYTVKMRLFYLQKQQNVQQKKMSLYKQFQSNLINARRLYTYCMGQLKISSTTKSSLLRQTQQLGRFPYNKDRQLISREKEKEKIVQLERFLNSILIDQRELSLIYSQIRSQ